MAQLKIILPIHSISGATLLIRGTSDRPSVAGATVKRVPELLQPYIAKKDWIEFCDKIMSTNKKEGAQACYVLVGLLGLLLFVAGSILASLHEVYDGWPWGVILIVVGIVLVPTVFRNCWKMELGLIQNRNDACRTLSGKLKSVLIFYRVYKRPRGYQNKYFDVQHQLEVIVYTVPVGQYTLPFHSMAMVERTETFQETDHWEILGGTGNETPGDFAEAYRAAIATADADAPTEVPSGSADDNGRRTSKAILLEQLDVMKGKLTDEQYETIASQILDSVRSIDRLHNNDPSVDDVESGEGATARMEHLDSIKGELTKEQYEARLKLILESI